MMYSYDKYLAENKLKHKNKIRHYSYRAMEIGLNNCVLETAARRLAAQYRELPKGGSFKTYSE